MTEGELFHFEGAFNRNYFCRNEKKITKSKTVAGNEETFKDELQPVNVSF